MTAPCPTLRQPSLGWLNPSPSCPLAQDTKPGGRDKKFKHSMNFPADLIEGVQAQGVEQRLVYIYIHSPCIFQVSRRSSSSSMPAPSPTPCQDAWGGWDVLGMRDCPHRHPDCCRTPTTAPC